MKKIILLTLIGLVLAVSMSQADFPRRSRSCYSPCFTPCYHETPYVAPVVSSAVTTIIQEPLPVFVFQNYSGFPNMPAAVPQQQYAPQAATPPQIGLSDKDVDRIANVVVQRLQASVGVAQQTNIIMPPVVESEEKNEPLMMTLAQVNDLGAKCSQCHWEGHTTKSGLSLFNQRQQWQPTKAGQPYDDGRILDRILAREMPPSAQTNPADSPLPDTIAFLKAAAGR